MASNNTISISFKVGDATSEFHKLTFRANESRDALAQTAGISTTLEMGHRKKPRSNSLVRKRSA